MQKQQPILGWGVYFVNHLETHGNTPYEFKKIFDVFVQIKKLLLKNWEKQNLTSIKTKTKTCQKKDGLVMLTFFENEESF